MVFKVPIFQNPLPHKHLILCLCLKCQAELTPNTKTIGLVLPGCTYLAHCRRAELIRAWGSLRGSTGGSTASARWWECEGHRGGSCQEAERGSARGAPSPTPRAERREQTLGRNGNRESETGSDTTNVLTKHGAPERCSALITMAENTRGWQMLPGLAGAPWSGGEGLQRGQVAGW